MDVDRALFGAFAALDGALIDVGEKGTEGVKDVKGSFDVEPFETTTPLVF
jgi:hypothetical protein